MGVVYEAWDSRLDRRVALKMVHSHLLTDPALIDAFVREAKHAARVEHPNVVRVYRVDVIDDQFVLEMQFVDGTPFSELLEMGPISPAHAANLLRQLLRALGACHEQRIIHCDLKPSNMLVTRHDRAMLTDFGIARALYEAGASDAKPEASTWLPWGTPQYSPPEAWSDHAVTPQWDLYAAGALIYEALAGEPPFQGETPADLINAVRTKTPRPLQEVCPDVSTAFADLVALLLARDPAARPASAQAALLRLSKTPESKVSNTDTEPIDAMPIRAADPKAGSARVRWSRFVLGTAAALAGLAAVSGLVYRQGKTDQQAKDSAPAVVSRQDSGLNELLVMGDDAYFAGDDGVRGRELWRSAAQKPVLVADVAPGPGSGNPRRFTARPLGGFVFAATTPETGEELWYCTDQGGGQYAVHMIKDIIPGPMGSDPEPVAAQGALVLFYATTLAEGRELWCTNIQEQQTAIVADVFPGPGGSVPMNPRVYPDEAGAYIVALSGAERGCLLYRYDYATNAMRELGDVAEDTAGLVRAGRCMLLPNTDDAHGKELWAYDEDTGKVALLVDLWPGTASSSPAELKTWGDRVLFQARTPESGAELWITDGTATGTRLVADINPGPGDSDPYGFVVVNEHVFFRAKDDACGRELWVTDGSRGGTARVADILPGAGSGEPYNLTPYASSLIFSANDGAHGEEFWGAFQKDGAWSASLLFDLEPGPLNSEPSHLQWCRDGTGFFIAKMPELGQVLFLLRPPGTDAATASGWKTELIATAEKTGAE